MSLHSLCGIRSLQLAVNNLYLTIYEFSSDGKYVKVLGLRDVYVGHHISHHGYHCSSITLPKNEHLFCLYYKPYFTYWFGFNQTSKSDFNVSKATKPKLVKYKIS